MVLIACALARASLLSQPDVRHLSLPKVPLDVRVDGRRNVARYLLQRVAWCTCTSDVRHPGRAPQRIVQASEHVVDSYRYGA